MVTGGPAKNALAKQAKPSPSSVRCSPGSLVKSFSATAPTTYTSPICSITGAIATGIMNKSGSQLRSGSEKRAIPEGKANHDASATGRKSTSPKQQAAMYPAVIPQTTGTSLSSPRPIVSTKIAVISDINASSQLLLAISTALDESERPIRIITGPITTGGKSLSNSRLPCHLTNALITKYTNETPNKPANVPGIPHCLLAEMMGAIKAKLEPKKIGTLPFVIK